MVYFRRFIWFIASKLIWLCAVLGILVCGFYMCFNIANIYIVLDEGMEKRVEVMLTRQEAEELNKYFDAAFLSEDSVLEGALDGTSAYTDYVITDFEYELTIEKLWSWPWDDFATCTVVERVPSITGSVLSSRKSEVSATVPAWKSGRYNITLVKKGSLWKIAGMQQSMELIEPQKGTDELQVEELTKANQ